MNESIAPFISQLYTWSKHCMWGNTPEPVANGMYSHTHTKRTRAYAHTHTHIHARTRAYAPTRGCARARAGVCVCVLNLLCILRCADVKFYIPPPPILCVHAYSCVEVFIRIMNFHSFVQTDRRPHLSPGTCTAGTDGVPLVEAVQTLDEFGAGDGQNGGVPVHLVEQPAVRRTRHADVALTGHQRHHARASLVQLFVVTLRSKSQESRSSDVIIGRLVFPHTPSTPCRCSVLTYIVN